MNEGSPAQKLEKKTAVKLVAAESLADRRNEIEGLIAQRAYQLFEGRGFQHGKDVEDWLKAENEIIHWCRHDLRESDESITLRAEMPSSYSADQMMVSVEPWRLIVSGEREIGVGYSDGVDTGTRVEPRRIFRAHDLAVKVDPSTSTAILQDNTLEVVMPKVVATKKPEAWSASSGE